MWLRRFPVIRLQFHLFLISTPDRVAVAAWGSTFNYPYF
jgi:hypothetical protein